MSLKARIDRLAHRLGADAPMRVVIFYGPRLVRHEIHHQAVGLTLLVPCPREADPMEHLSPEQGEAIGPADSVVSIQAANNPRDRPGFSYDDRDDQWA